MVCMCCSKIVCCLMQNNILCCFQEYVQHRYILGMDQYIQCMNNVLVWTTCCVLFKDIQSTYCLLVITALFIMGMYTYKTI
jgi:hypothetical protein